VGEPDRLWRDAAIAERCAKLGGVLINPRGQRSAEVGFRGQPTDDGPAEWDDTPDLTLEQDRRAREMARGGGIMGRRTSAPSPTRKDGDGVR